MVHKIARLWLLALALGLLPVEALGQEITLKIPEYPAEVFPNYARVLIPTAELPTLDLFLSGARTDIQLSTVRVTLNQMPVMTLVTVYPMPRGVRASLRLRESLNPDMKLRPTGENLITFEALDDLRTRHTGQFYLTVSPVQAPQLVSAAPSQPNQPPGGQPSSGFPALSFAVKMDDANANRMLEGGERFTIRVSVTNTGSAAANDVGVTIAGEAAIVSAITPQKAIGRVAAGQTVIAEFPGMLPAQVEPRNVELKVSLAEGKNDPGASQTVRLALVPGEVRETTTVLSEIVDVDFPPKAISLPERASSLAVVIGIGSYREEPAIPKLPFARHDAEIMARYLENVAGIKKENIKLLLDDRATLTDIVETIDQWLPRRTDENASVFLYYAGHGALDPATGETYVVPYEGHPDSPSTRLYSVKRLYEKLEALAVKDVTVFLDSCFSGAGGRSIRMSGRPIVVTSTNPMLSSKKLAVLAAATGSQVSSDLEKPKHGLFTYFLLKGIRGEANANRDAWIDLDELYNYVRKNVQSTALSELNREQTPVLIGASDVESRAKTLKLFGNSGTGR